jgi:hypothetical protein
VESFTPRTLYPRGKSPWYPLERRLGGPRAGLDNLEKRKFFTLTGLELQPLGRPARNQSLYRVCYPGSRSNNHKILNLPYPNFCQPYRLSKLQHRIIILYCSILLYINYYSSHVQHHTTCSTDTDHHQMFKIVDENCCSSVS